MTCRDIAHAAHILSDTGTLEQAVPVVMNMTGLEAAEIASRVRAICNGDPSELTLAEPRAENRTAIWLMEVRLAAMEEALPAEEWQAGRRRVRVHAMPRREAASDGTPISPLLWPARTGPARR